MIAFWIYLFYLFLFILSRSDYGYKIAYVQHTTFRAISAAHRRPRDDANGFPRERFSVFLVFFLFTGHFRPSTFSLISLLPLSRHIKEKQEDSKNSDFWNVEYTNNSDDGTRYVGPRSWHLFSAAAMFFTHFCLCIPPPFPSTLVFFCLYSPLCWSVFFCCPWVVLRPGYLSWAVGVSAFLIFSLFSPVIPRPGDLSRLVSTTSHPVIH